MKKPDEYTVRLILEWDYEEPAPGYTSRLEDARRLERMFKAERQATKLDVFRNIRVYDGQITANTTLANIDNGIVALLIKMLTRNWMRRGVHRKIYCAERGKQRKPL